MQVAPMSYFILVLFRPLIYNGDRILSRRYIQFYTYLTNKYIHALRVHVIIVRVHVFTTKHKIKISRQN